MRYTINVQFKIYMRIPKDIAVDISKPYPNVPAKTHGSFLRNIQGFHLRSVHSNNQVNFVRTVQITKHCFIFFHCPVLTFYEKQH